MSAQSVGMEKMLLPGKYKIQARLVLIVGPLSLVLELFYTLKTANDWADRKLTDQ